MTNNMLPEEKLLRLIKGGAKAAIKPESHQANPPEKEPKIALPSINFPHFTFNKIIGIVFAISTLWLGYSFAEPFIFKNKTEIPDAKFKEGLVEKNSQPKIKGTFKPYAFYLDGFKSNNIFSGTTAYDSAKPIGTASADLIKDINLVGIISGDEPQAIVEDKRAQKTYYLKKGQFIGELQVVDILEGKVILGYNDENYELYL